MIREVCSVNAGKRRTRARLQIFRIDPQIAWRPGRGEELCRSPQYPHRLQSNF